MAQALLVVRNLATHGGLGDCCYLGLAPRSVGHLVDALDVDQRGVHVKGDQLEVRQAQGRGEALNDKAGGESCHVRLGRFDQPVFQRQVWYAAELRICGNQRGTQCERVGRDEGVVGANGLTCLFESGTQ